MDDVVFVPPPHHPAGDPLRTPPTPTLLSSGEPPALSLLNQQPLTLSAKLTAAL